MKPEYLGLMECPDCGGSLGLSRADESDGAEVVYGTVACPCGEYPVLAGILCLKKGLPVEAPPPRASGKERRAAAGFLLNNRKDRISAILTGLRASTWGRFPEKAVGRLIDAWSLRICRRYEDPGATCFGLLGDDPSSVYLRHRFSTDSFWTLYPLLPLLEQKKDRVLDLGCGAGHAAFVLSRFVEPRQLICADHDFRRLFIARKFFAPEAGFVCLDAGDPLPFRRGAFTSILSLDAFHYVRNVSRLAGEMERVVSPRGLILILHLHARAQTDAGAPNPCAVPHWRDLFKRMPLHAVPEERLLEDFMENGRLDLARHDRDEELASSRAVDVVATEDHGLLREYPHLWPDHPAGRTRLLINPLYNPEKDGDALVLRRQFPLPSFTEEYPLSARYLPEECRMERGFTLQAGTRRVDIDREKITDEERTRLSYLMKRFVVIPAPDRYL